MAREKVDNKLNVVIGTQAQIEGDTSIPENSIIIVTDEVITADEIVYSAEKNVKEAIDEKQDKLVAGDGITIDENNEISASGGGGGGTQLYTSYNHPITEMRFGEDVSVEADIPYFLSILARDSAIKVTQEHYIGSWIKAWCFWSTSNSGLAIRSAAETNDMELYGCICGWAEGGGQLQLISGNAYYADGTKVPYNTNLPLHKIMFFHSDCAFNDND